MVAERLKPVLETKGGLAEKLYCELA